MILRIYFATLVMFYVVNFSQFDHFFPILAKGLLPILLEKALIVHETWLLTSNSHEMRHKSCCLSRSKLCLSSVSIAKRQKDKLQFYCHSNKTIHCSVTIEIRYYHSSAAMVTRQCYSSATKATRQ